MLVIVYRLVKNNSSLAEPPSCLLHGERTNFILVHIVPPFNGWWRTEIVLFELFFFISEPAAEPSTVHFHKVLFISSHPQTGPL